MCNFLTFFPDSVVLLVLVLEKRGLVFKYSFRLIVHLLPSSCNGPSEILERDFAVGLDVLSLVHFGSVVLLQILANFLGGDREPFMVRTSNDSFSFCLKVEIILL